MLGGLAFLLVAWLPGLAAVAGGPSSTGGRRPRGRSPGASHGCCSSAIVLGVVVSVLGFLLQGASAAGVSLWASLKGAIVENTLDSRFGEVWGAARDRLARARSRAAGARASVATRSRCCGPTRRSRAMRARAGPPPPVLALLAIGSAYLACTPALGGHASIQSPTGRVLPLRRAARAAPRASGSEGSPACCWRCRRRRAGSSGPSAAGCCSRRSRASRRSRSARVVAIAITGVIQAYIDVRSVHGLLHSTYGALIIVKTVLLVVADRPRLGQPRAGDPRARSGSSAPAARPARIGVLARRTMRGELALMLCVFGVTAALISYAPPIDAASGPFSTNTTLGPAELEMTVEPARVGLNTVHLYLIDAKTGAQFTGDQGTHRHREAAREGHRPAAAAGKRRRPGPLHPELGRAQPGRHVGNRNHRPRVRIRAVHPDRQGADPMSSPQQVQTTHPHYSGARQT